MRLKGTRKATRKGTRKGTRKVNKRGGGWFWNRKRPGRGEVYFPSSNQDTYNKQVAAAKRQASVRRGYNNSEREEKRCISDCTQRCKEDHRGRIASSYTFSPSL